MARDHDTPELTMYACESRARQAIRSGLKPPPTMSMVMPPSPPWAQCSRPATPPALPAARMTTTSGACLSTVSMVSTVSVLSMVSATSETPLLCHASTAENSARPAKADERGTAATDTSSTTVVTPSERSGCYTTGCWCWRRSEMAFAVLALLTPLAIVAGACAWPASAVFALCSVSLAGLVVVGSTTLERVGVVYTTCFATGMLLEIVPVLFPTLIGIVAVMRGETSLAKSFVIGNVVSNILLGTGLALLVGDIRPGCASYSARVDERTLEPVKLTLVATAPVIVAWAMIYATIQKATTAAYRDSTNSSTVSTTATVTGLSRGTAVILLAVFVFWIIFRRGSHRAVFATIDGDRCAPKTPLLEQRPDAEKEAPPPPSTKLRTRALVMAVFAVALAIAAAVAATVCAWFLVHSTDSIVTLSRSTPSTSSSATAATLRRPFAASVVLPLVVNVYNHLRAAELAAASRDDVSLAVHRTYAAGACAILCTLPVLVLVGWAVQRPLLLDFDVFDVSVLASGVWATSVAVTCRVDYFRGLVMLCLYAILALALFLFKE